MPINDLGPERMTALAAVPPPPPVPGAAIAGFWRRMAALAIDYLIVATPVYLIGSATSAWAANLGPAGKLIGFIPALLYFSLLNSAVGGDRTIGKRLLGIRVIDRAGAALSLPRSIVRFLVIAVPWFLNGLWLDVDAAAIDPLELALGYIAAFLVFGGLGSIAYLYVFNRTTRQSLHNLATGSFVVRGAPALVTHTIPILHLIVVGIVLTIGLVGPGVAFWVLHSGRIGATMEPLVALQSAIRSRHPGAPVKVVAGESIFTSTATGSTTVRYLQVEVASTNPRENDATLQDAIAGIVLDLLGRQALVVIVHHHVDLGLFSWDTANREAWNASAWRERRSRSAAGGNRI
jgi:uncharacterized RDD family membrane protein YckC